MNDGWARDDLRRVDAADELRITAVRVNGEPLRSTPIWAVCVDSSVYVRTWQRRTTGWFGHALASGRAAVSVPGLEADVTVDDVGAEPADLRRAVDDAYRAKYARYGGATDRMTGDDAAATTLRLTPAAGAPR